MIAFCLTCRCYTRHGQWDPYRMGWIVSCHGEKSFVGAEERHVELFPLPYADALALWQHLYRF